ncbi:hypothetical protein BDW74DRAFT_177697 [Aspergillus multicolor]|uniref:uncharacterized protein n=1 Tax=Aspergillus multicolor TaxID=41759 RepID=UPI003CCDD601
MATTSIASHAERRGDSRPSKWNWAQQLDTSTGRAYDQELQISPKNPKPYSFSRTSSSFSNFLSSAPPVRRRIGSSSKVSIGRACPNRLDGLLCWDPHWHALDASSTSSKLRHDLCEILASERGKLLKGRSCLPTIGCGIFMVGPSKDEAKPRFVVSCNDRDVCKVLRKIFKSEALTSDYLDFEPLITTSFPRSPVPLQRLAGHGSIGSVEVDLDDFQDASTTQLPLEESFTVSGDVFMEGSVLSHQTLLIPAQVRFGSSANAPTAVLGGLIRLKSNKELYGVTVAHCSAKSPIHAGTDWIDDHGDFESDRDGPHSAQPPPEPSAVKDTRAQGVTRIGSIAYTSAAIQDGQDWALIKLDDSLTLRTLAPYPARLAPQIDASHHKKGVYVSTSRSLIPGILLPNPYWVMAPGEKTMRKSYAVQLNENAENGDCGSWVVGEQKQELLGRIAFGHPDDKCAYMLPAKPMFDQIAAMVKDEPGISVGGPGFKQTLSAQPDKERRPAFMFEGIEELSEKAPSSPKTASEHTRSTSSSSLEDFASFDKDETSGKDTVNDDKAETPIIVDRSSGISRRQRTEEGKNDWRTRSPRPYPAPWNSWRNPKRPEVRLSPPRPSKRHRHGPVSFQLEDTEQSEEHRSPPSARRDHTAHSGPFHAGSTTHTHYPGYTSPPYVPDPAPSHNYIPPYQAPAFNPPSQNLYYPPQMPYPVAPWGYQSASGYYPAYPQAYAPVPAPMQTDPQQQQPSPSNAPRPPSSHPAGAPAPAPAPAPGPAPPAPDPALNTMLTQLERLLSEERDERLRRDAENTEITAIEATTEQPIIKIVEPKPKSADPPSGEWSAREKQLLDAALVRTRDAVREQKRVEEAVRKAKVRSWCCVQ